MSDEQKDLEICSICGDPFEVGKDGGYCEGCGFPFCTGCYLPEHLDSGCGELIL